MTDEVTQLVPNEGSPGAQIEALSRQNARALQNMNQRGVGVQDIEILNLRLDTLIDFLVGPSMRLPFEGAFHLQLQQLIAEHEAQSARATLLDGVQIQMPTDLA